VSINFYDAAESVLPLPSGKKVKISVSTEYPYDGRVVVGVEPETKEAFCLRLRLPGWCSNYTLQVNGAAQELKPVEMGYLMLQRSWSPGDQVEFVMDMPIVAAADTMGNVGRVAIMRGPLVFAADSAYLPSGVLLDDVILALDSKAPTMNIRVLKNETISMIHLVARRLIRRAAKGENLWREKERYNKLVSCAPVDSMEDIELVPFFETGNKNFHQIEGIRPHDEAVRRISFQVWLPYNCAAG